jgi:hypothetical protein
VSPFKILKKNFLARKENLIRGFALPKSETETDAQSVHLFGLLNEWYVSMQPALECMTIVYH